MDATLLNRITVNPRQCGGSPCIRGMRIRVSDVLDLFAAGLDAAQILAEMPDLEVKDIQACHIIDAERRLSEVDTDNFLDRLRQVEFDDVWDGKMNSDAASGGMSFLVREGDDARSRGTLRDWPTLQT